MTIETMSRRSVIVMCSTSIWDIDQF